MATRTGNDSWRARVDRLEEAVKIRRDWSYADTIRFLALSLAGEAGEVANEVKKEWRSNGYKNWTPNKLAAYEKGLAFELADVQMLLYRLCANLNIDIDAACDNKIDELDQRHDLIIANKDEA